MKKAYCLVFGILAMVTIILIGGCNKVGDEDYIPPESRASAIYLDENEAKEQAEAELINELGQDYFTAHYTYLRTEPFIQNGEKIGYTIYYTYDYNIENFEPEEMDIYIGAAGPEHRIFYNKDEILNSPVEIVYSDTSTAETDCQNAFPDETREITGWEHSFYTGGTIYTVGINKDRIILESIGRIENTDEAILCEFDVADGTIIESHAIFRTKV